MNASQFRWAPLVLVGIIAGLAHVALGVRV